MRRLYYEQFTIENYLEYCRIQKRLDSQTLKAYRIDLRQFSEQIWIIEASELTVPLLETYIAKLHQQYAPKTVKRKIASLKALFHHLEYKEIILHNPFAKLQLRFREPIILPKTIPLPKKHDHRYCHLAGIRQHITPHMFRHSFATLLLEQNVDIRYIQTMLGHSSINVTEIYTHVTMTKQKDILKAKHPRKSLNIINQL